ncbi:unnamed protein product, partial [Heterotrigona itama]
VAWLRVDTQTILTIANHVITKNHRIGVTHTERKTWHLHIRDVSESDRGAYMCQINTDPMKSQTGYLDVVVPPDILDYMTSTDMIVREGSNVTLRCAAKGSPTPNITWRREDGDTILLGNGEDGKRHVIKNKTATSYDVFLRLKRKREEEKKSHRVVGGRRREKSVRNKFLGIIFPTGNDLS